MQDYLSAAKKYTQENLSDTEEYKENVDNNYYHISVFSQYLAQEAYKDPEIREKVRECIEKSYPE
jgi:trehalose/maltose hydrolase-like predicted phosphorylase